MMKTRIVKLRLSLMICLVIAIFLNLSLIVPQLEDLPRLDESEFVDAARAISKSGVPFSTFWNKHGNYLLWHPPLYQYISAVVIRFSDPGWIAIRIVQHIFFGGALFLLFRLFMYPKFYESTGMALEQKVWVPILIVSFTLINPFMIQSVLLIDIDNNVLFFFITLFLFFFILRAGNTNIGVPYLLGILFCCTLWAKMTTTLALPILVFLYYSANFGFKKAIFFVMKFLSIGIVLFLLSYSLYTFLTGVPFSQPFQHPRFYSAGQNISTLFSYAKISGIVKELVLVIVWLTPATFILFVIGIKDRINKIFRTKKLVPVDIFAIFGLIMFIVYILFGGTPFYFPKYQGLMIPFLLMPVAPLVVTISRELLKNMTGRDKYFLIIIFLIVFLYSYFVVRDPLYSMQADVFSRSWLHKLWIISLYVLPVPVVLALLKINFFNISLKELLVIAALFVLVTSNISMSLHQSKADYSTRYYYGERGLNEVVNYVSANHNGQLIFARKDIGWLSGAKWYQADGFLAEGNSTGLKHFKGILRTSKPFMVVISYRRSNIRNNAYLRKITNEILNPSGYYLQRKIGDFEVFKRTLISLK